MEPRPRRPVRGNVDGHPVESFGEFDVYRVSPTYDESVEVQAGNENSWRKIEPRRSWEICRNVMGLTPTRSPSVMAPEWEPHSPLAFIDGSPATVGHAGRPIGDPEISRAWVRIDLPRPTVIAGVGLVPAAGGEWLPGTFDVRAFNWDLWQRDKGSTVDAERKKWTTVYRFDGGHAQRVERPDNTAPAVYEPEETSSSDGSPVRRCRFDPIVAREVWVTSPDDFRLGGVEVYDDRGENVALISRGAGSTVSAEDYLFWASERTQTDFWELQYDLGIKWLRLSYYLTPLIWNFVEREKGVYTIDPYIDEKVTECGKHGIEIALTLGPDANPLYADETPGSRAREIDAFCDYCRFMVRHFKGRVRYFEILNEYDNQHTYGPNVQRPVEEIVDRYLSVALPAAKVIREEYPEAKIALCGPCPLSADFILTALRKGMVEYADVVTWHPYQFMANSDDDYPPEELDLPNHVWLPDGMTNYADAVVYVRTEAAKLGFHGELHANEVGAYAIHNDRTSNLIAAKYLARSAVVHAAVGAAMFWNETTSLMRPPWQPYWSRHAPVMKPAHSYYVMRTLGTLLDGAGPEDATVETSEPVERFESRVFCLPSGDRLVAVWIAEKSRKHRCDDYAGPTVALSIDLKTPRKVVGIDLLNGRERELDFGMDHGHVVVTDVALLDYPHFLRFVY